MHRRMSGFAVSGLLAVAAACGGEAGRSAGDATSAALQNSEGGSAVCAGRLDFGQPGERIESELNIARRTVCLKYRHLADALADGYVNTGLACVPGQGFHYIRTDLVGTTDPHRPPVLMYDADGELTGPEWVAPEDRPAPFIFGQQLHADDDVGLSILHVWVWKLNANGVFDDVNPIVTCP